MNDALDPAHSWQLTIDTTDPARLVAFWGPVLGYLPEPPPPGHATWNDWYRSVGVPEHELDSVGDGCDRLFDPHGRGPKIWFQWVPEAKSGKNRLHLDVFVNDRRNTSYALRKPQVEERVRQLIERGATLRHVEDTEQHGRFYAVLLDPCGNEFCVT